MANNRSDFFSRKRVWQRVGLLIVLGLAVHLIFPRIAYLRNSIVIISKMLYWGVGLAFLSEILSYLGMGCLMKQTFAIVEQRLSMFRGALVYLGAYSISMVAAGTIGFSAAIFQWTNGKKGNVQSATLASFIPTLFNDFILIFFSIFGLIYLFFTHRLTQSLLVGFGMTVIILGIITVLVVIAMNHRPGTSKFIIWCARLIARIRRRVFNAAGTQAEIELLFVSWDTLWRSHWTYLAFWAFLNAGFDMLVLYLMFIASGMKIDLAVLISGYGLPMLLGKMAFILPGGVGVVESSMIAMFNGLDVPGNVTIVVVLGYRLISFWIPALLGFIAATYLSREKSRQGENSPDGTPDKLEKNQ